MKIVIQHVKNERVKTLNAIVSVFPQALIVECDGNPMETFKRSIVDYAHWHNEDDAVLAPDFIERAMMLEHAHRSIIINAFSITNKYGSLPGSLFSSTVCIFFPNGYGSLISGYAETWKRIDEHPTGFDLMIRDWLISRREKFWLESPSLVQHAQCKSLLGPRSTKRISPSFKERYGELNG
jgi:hypothetical protein